MIIGIKYDQHQYVGKLHIKKYENVLDLREIQDKWETIYVILVKN